MSKDQKHNKLIMEQFSKQAAFKLIIKTIGIGRNETVLDVACGPGMFQSSHLLTELSLLF